MTPYCGLILAGKLAVIASTTLAGAKIRFNMANASCSQEYNLLYKCSILDSGISKVALYTPWVLTMCIIVFLGLPTILLESRYPEKGTRALIALFWRQTTMMYLTHTLAKHAFYTIGLHTCVHTLLSIQVGPHLVGGDCWWGLRYLGVAGLVYISAVYGPGVSVVSWPSSSSPEALACAGLSHLLGTLLPDLFLAWLSFSGHLFLTLFARDWARD